MFKKSGRGFKRPFCINPECSNFTPEEKRGGYKKKTADSEAVPEAEEKKAPAKKAAVKRPAAPKTTAKKTAAKKPAVKKTAKKAQEE